MAEIVGLRSVVRRFSVLNRLRKTKCWFPSANTSKELISIECAAVGGGGGGGEAWMLTVRSALLLIVPFEYVTYIWISSEPAVPPLANPTWPILEYATATFPGTALPPLVSWPGPECVLMKFTSEIESP